MLYLGTVMPVLVLGPRGGGKTTVALGLARTVRRLQPDAPLLRLGSDEAARRDARLFQALGLSPQGEPLSELSPSLPPLAIVEAGDERPPSRWREAGARLMAVARYPHLVEGVRPLWEEVGEAFLGAVVTCVPKRRLEKVAHELTGQGLPLLALVPEDRALASPTLGQLRVAIEAEALFAEGRDDELLVQVAISSIAKDPGQDYFARLQPQAVIVRSDRPDQQLAALNAGIRCLVVTGDIPLLSYVLTRAEEEGVAVLATRLGTVEVVAKLDEIMARIPLQGREKAERAAALLAEAVDSERLLALLGGSQPSL